MNKVKKQVKRVLSFLVCAALVMSGLMVPTKQVQAEENPTTAKTIAGLGTSMIVDPTAPENDSEAWKGSYVYYGNYDADGNGTTEPVKYRVLDASTTDYSADGTTQTMLLDCDSILYGQQFDNDGIANADGKKVNDWSISDVKNSLNGDGFLNKNGVFTTNEKNAIAASTVESHALTTDSETGVNVEYWTQSVFANYVALTGEQIFLLDVEDVSNGAYGYSIISESCQSRKKTGGAGAYWWLRSASNINDNDASYVDDVGYLYDNFVYYDAPGVSPALNLNLSSVLFTSVVSGTAGETGAEYKLTLLDSDMTVAPESNVTKSGNTVTVSYSVNGRNNGNSTQVSVLILDKKYTVGNTNNASVLAYDKLNVDDFFTSGTGTFTIPDSLSGKTPGTDYHVYLIAEDVNGEKETDYASVPVEIHLWEAPIAKQMNFGTQGIIDPAVPNSASEAWKGCYVYYGNYDTDGDGTAEPVKYRVLDASTTDYSADGTTQTMLLDCDSILYYQTFNNNSMPDEEGEKVNDWSISDVKNSLNGDDFLNKDGVFTTNEKNAITASTVESHALTTDSETGVGVTSWTQSNFVNYVALTGEQIFLLDAEDVSNGAYGYSITDESCQNRKKTDNSDDYWWLRSARNNRDSYVGCVDDEGVILHNLVDDNFPGVSPALNLNLSSVLFSSASVVSKSSALASESMKIGTEANTEWKLTLKDDGKSVTLTEGRSVTKAGNGTITVPYTYTDNENVTDREKVNQISVMITDKAYGSENAQILYYGALQNIKDAEGTDSTVADASTGTGTFALPNALTEKTQGEDYHIYLLAEHVNDDNATDYASEPKEICLHTGETEVKDAKKATCAADGYTGDTYCKNCGEKIVTGTKINKSTVHTWDAGVVTKVATAAEKGEKTYTCSVCKTTRTEEILALGAPAVGEEITSEDGSATYKVTKTGDKGNAVTYEAPTNKKATAVVVPATVTINDITYEVTSISATAFAGNKKLTSVTIGNNVKSIPANAFKNFKKLTTVKMGTGVKTVGKNAFYGCSKLKNLTIGKNVTTISDKAFYKCTSLTKVTIPSKVKKIGKSAFYGCSKMKTLTIKSSKLTTKKIGSKAFTKTPKSMTVKVPKKKFKAYKSMLIKRGVNKKARFKKS